MTPAVSNTQPESLARVLWLSFPFPPAMSAGVFRSVRFVRYLGEFNWQPVVLTVRTTDEFKQDSTLSSYLPEGIPIHATSMWRPENWKSKLLGRDSAANGRKASSSKANDNSAHNSGQKGSSLFRTHYKRLRQRLLNTPDSKIWWAIPAYRSALNLIRSQSPEAIFSTAPPHSSHLLGTWLKRKTGLPLVLDFRDPWARAPWATGRVDPALVRKNCQMERKCVTHADAVILNTPRTEQEFRNYYGAQYADRFYTIPNGFDPALIDQTCERDTRKNDRSGRFLIRHVGTIYGRRELRPLLQAIRLLIDRGTPICFEQIGLVKVDYDLQACIDSLALQDHVRILEPVAHHEALACIGSTDCQLIIQPDSELQIPGKLFEMIQFRKPIISLTGEGATGDIVRRFQLGPVVDPVNPQAIASAIRELAEGPCVPSKAGLWEAAIQEFNGRNQTGRLAEILNHVASR